MIKKLNKKFAKGFTLVELLIVIAIVGILTAIMITNFSQTKAKSRDGKRISDIANIQLAIDLFFDRCNGFPTDTNNGIFNGSNAITFPYQCPGQATINLSNYISSIPKDPNGSGYLYVASGANVDYILRATLETSHSALSDDLDGTIYNVDCSDGSFFYCVSSRQ